MQKWLVPCNVNKFDIVSKFEKNEFIHFHQDFDVGVGDIIYIYLDDPYFSIKYEVRAIDVDLMLSFQPINKTDTNEKISNNYEQTMNIQLLREFRDDMFPLYDLKNNGVSSVEKPKKIDKQIETYFSDRINEIEGGFHNYFFVNQSSAKKQSIGNYLWVPKLGSNYNTVHHSARIEEVRKGDWIIHYSNKKIVAVSKAKNDVYEIVNTERESFEAEQIGMKVDVDYFSFQYPLDIKDIMNAMKNLQPDKYSPLNKTRKINLGYLFSATRYMLELVIRRAAAKHNEPDQKQKILDLIYMDMPEESNGDRELSYLGEVEESIFSMNNESVEYIPRPKARPEKFLSNPKNEYVRDSKVAANALARANHQCELNEDHPSFISKRTGENYTEPHHLIPFSNQEDFDYSIDVEANIVSLCSTCHNEIHYGQNADEQITRLYNIREKELAQAGIPIKLKDLFRLY